MLCNRKVRNVILNKRTPIDIVILWVDGNDPEWKKQRNNILESNGIVGDASEVRYRDWDLLRYWFRTIEKNIPWYNRVFFVTCGQYPSWLNLSCSKLKVVNHKDFIPSEYLPTFNSNAIEVNLHRIDELSENFILFNDDMFVIRSMKETDFFINNIPCDEALLDALCPSGSVSNILSNNMAIINNYFNKKEVITLKNKKWFSIKYGVDLYRTLVLYPWARFSGIYNQHLPIAHKKNTFFEVWNKEGDMLRQTSSNKFRSNNDVSHWLFRYWRLVKGDFIPRRICGSFFSVGEDDTTVNKIVNTIIKPKVDMICINDSDKVTDFEKKKQIIKSAFDRMYPNKSIFEK